MVCSSSRENTLPVGLFGELITIARVRLLNALLSSSGSKPHAGSRKRT
jgi:hypothetical protein